VTTKGQVTIPVTIRYALGIAAGDEIIFRVRDGHGVFRRADGVLTHQAALGISPGRNAQALERFLCVGDAGFADGVRAARAAGERITLGDETVIAVANTAARHDVNRDLLAECLRDVVAERALRFTNARALRLMIDAVAAGDDPTEAYRAARR
jgi:AbrB family looped-hinge helix DNA binding protein